MKILTDTGLIVLWQKIKDLYKKTSVSAKQTTTSTADGGTNVMTFTFGDGTSTTLYVKNGSKGSDGARGATGVKGEKGDRGPVGETGPQGNSGIADASNKTLVNDAITGGETDFLSAEVGKLGILTYDCSKGGTVTHATLQDAINSVPTTFQKVGLTIIFKSGGTIYRYALKANSWSADPANWYFVEELLDVISLQDNEEYLAVEQDAEGKVLSATNPDGSHYIHNAKSETIPTEFEHIEDPEGRTEITTDAENKILGYRDSEGTRHEHKISAKHLELSSEAAKEVNEAFKSAGIKMENPSDFSKDRHIELPIPRIAAQVRLYAPKLPTTKQDDIEAEIEYNDKDGNYFRKPVILNAQGSSSMGYYVKNMAIDISDGSEIKFGDFPTQDSFHLKKYYIDAFRGQCIVGYWLMEQVYKSHPIGQQYPYEYSYSNESTTDSLGDVKKDFFTGAKCHPDGFPIIITWVNSKTNEETWMGVYTWNLKKSKEVYFADKKKAKNIILDGDMWGTLFNGTPQWTSFEVRNPKSLKDIDENKYDGDNPKELSNTDILSKEVKGYITRLSQAYTELNKSKTKETFEKYFMPKPFIDYWLVSQVLYNLDGFGKNWIWCTWDGNLWTPTMYDVDSIFGMHWNGTYVVPGSDKNFGNWNVLYLDSLYANEIKLRYRELRDKNVFSVSNICSLLDKWINSIGYENYKKEFEKYNDTPSYRSSKVADGWQSFGYASTQGITADEYTENKEYAIGDICIYQEYAFKATKVMTNVPPLTGIYPNAPKVLGFYNSKKRVENWLTNKISSLDSKYEYNV